MGVLDEIGAELTGASTPPAETVVDTPLQPGGTLDKIAADLQKQKDLEAYSRIVPGGIQMPDVAAGPIRAAVEPKAPSLPINITPSTIPNPSGLPKPMDVFQQNEYQKQMGGIYQETQRHVVGPPEPGTVTKEIDQYPEEKAKIHGFLESVGADADPTAATKTLAPILRAAWISTPAGAASEAVAPYAKAFGAGVFDNLTALCAMAAKISNQAFNHGQPGTMDPASEGALHYMRANAEELWQSSGLATDPGAGNFVGQLARGVGGMSIDLPVIMVYGGAGLAVLGAFRGLADGGPTGMLEGATEGFLMGRLLSGMDTLGKTLGMAAAPTRPIVGKAMSAGLSGATFASMAAAEGAPTPEVIRQGLIGIGLGALSGVSPEAKELKAREGADRYAMRIIGEIDPSLRREDFDPYGGPASFLSKSIDVKADLADRLAAGDKTISPKELESITKPTPTSIQEVMEPQGKAADAMRSIAGRMEGQDLIYKHLESRINRDYTQDPEERAHHQMWTDILGKEIMNRGLQPIETTDEWSAKRFPTLESKEEVFGKTLGIQPLFMDPKWYWYLKEKGLVPPGVKEPAGADRYRPDRWRNPLHPAAMAEAAGATMMVDRPYTEYPQGGEGEPRQVNKLVPAIDVNDVRLNALNEGNTPGYEPDPTLRTKRPYRDEKSGRWFVPAPLGHPGANQNGMIPWSRLVFENKRGGYLRPEEVVHHGPDFNPGNNAPENLHAFSNNEAHMDYHNSEQGIQDRINQAEIRAQQESDAEVNHPKDYIIYVENTKTGEFLPAQPNHPTGPYDIIIQQYKSGKHNVIDYGKSVPPELVERAGGPPAGPEAGGATAMPAAELDRITGDIAQLVNEAPGGPHQYGWSYHPMKGDSQLGWANGQHVLSKWPDRGDIYTGAKPTDEQISQFVLKNADLLEDPRNFVDGYTADNGDFHLDISTTEADRAKAEAYGKQYDQKAVGFLHPTEGYQDIPTGGTGRRWTPEEAQAAGWAHPTKRNEPLPGPQEGQGGAPVTEPGPGPAPAGQPPVTPENPATPDDLTGASSLYKPGEGFLSGMKTPGLSIVKPEDAARTTAALRNLRTALMDKYYPIHRLVKAIKKEGVQIQDAHNPSLLISTLGGVSGKAQAKIAYKTFHVDADGFIQFDGKGLTEILKPHAEELDAFDNYMIAARALEIERANKSRLIEDKIDTGIDLPWAKKTYAEGHEKFSPAHKEYVGYFHSMLDELANVGLLKKEVVKKWKEDSPEYAPLKRDMESIADSLDKGAGPNGRSRQMLNKVMNPIMRMKGGGELPVLPPSQSAVMMTYEITNAIERARAARSVIELRNMSPDLAKLITPATGPGKDVVVVPENGEMAYWHVPQDISDAMKLIHETGLSSLVRAFAMPSRLLRAGATLSPEFVLRVPGRRMLTAFMNAEHGFNPLTDFPRGLYDVIKKPEEYWKWKASGGDQSMINSMSKTFASDELKAMSDEKQAAMIEAAKPFLGFLASTSKVAATLLHPLGAMESLSNYGEKPTRLGVYGRASRAGESDLASAAESRRASTDFSVKGGANGVKQVAAGYAFLNARVQTTRTIFDTAIEHPGRTALRGIAAATIPSIVLYAINRNDPEYWKRDQAERDLMWFLPIKIGGRQVRFPKGLVGVVFGTGIEKVMEAMDSKAETRSALTEWLNEVLKNILPVSNIGEAIPVALRPVAEAALNRNFFYGNAIESDTDKGVAPYLRFGPRTSETMKLIGEKLGAFNKGEGVSPKMMEEVVHGYTGGVGRHALEASDWALGKLGITKTGEKATDPANAPGLAGFMSRRAVGFESQPAKDFYDMMPEVKKTQATLDTLYDMAAAAGNNEEVTNKVKEMMIWLDNHKTETALLRDLMPQLVKAEADLSLLKKQQNEVVQDKTYTSDKKRAMLDEIDQQVSTIVDPLSKLILHYKKSPPAASK
jgi:hypothetical protein